MSVTRRHKVTHGLGFHANCGGVVFNQKRRKHSYAACADCRASSVPQADITQERFEVPRQDRAGRKRRVPRYDIKSWRDVK